MHPGVARALRESEWQQRVVNHCIGTGWIAMHVRPTLPGQQSRRRTTATSVSGWPDLVLIHPDRGLADIYQQTDPHHQEVAS